LIYLDNAATTPILPEAREAFSEATELFANPSSLHSFGYKAKCEIEKHRQSFADNFRCESKEIYFTSGGTESNNLAILGALKAMRNPKKVLSFAFEHPSVLEAVKNSGVKCEILSSISQLENALSNDINLVSLMHINNETGEIYPINEIYDLVKSKSRALLHVDNVQGFGKLPNIKADLISFSAHKIGGFKGIGGLYVRDGVKIKPIIFGGGQEQGLRSGTENLPLIASFAKAAELAFSSDISKVIELNNIVREELDGVLISGETCSPYIINLRFDGVMGETLLHCLEQHEIYIGIGSACSSHGAKASETLKAMGLSSKQIKESIRISFSPQNTEDEVRAACEVIKNEVEILRGIKR